MTTSYDVTRAADGLYACGHALLSEERFHEAASVFRALAAALPEDERGWLGLGACHEGVGQPEIAAQMYETGAAIVPGSTRVQLALSRALRGLGKDTEADTALDRAEAAADASDDTTMAALVTAERRAS
jgi:Flp pilus assembly protein TadD